jgi:glucan phosphoethanolaminetransferase (alkaline phosphatase superfamily)
MFAFPSSSSFERYSILHSCFLLFLLLHSNAIPFFILAFFSFFSWSPLYYSYLFFFFFLICNSFATIIKLLHHFVQNKQNNHNYKTNTAGIPFISLVSYCFSLRLQLFCFVLFIDSLSWSYSLLALPGDSFCLLCLTWVWCGAGRFIYLFL